MAVRRSPYSTDGMALGDNMMTPRSANAGLPGGTAAGGTGPVATNPGQSGGELPAPPPAPVTPPLVTPMEPTFDPHAQVGHNGTINGMNREQYRDAWMGSGAKSMDDLNKFLTAHGGTLTGANGTVQTPFGEQLDMLFNAKGSAAGNGPAGASWGGVGGPSGGGPVPNTQPTTGDFAPDSPWRNGINFGSPSGSGNPGGPGVTQKPAPMDGNPMPGMGSPTNDHGGLDEILNALMSGDMNKDVLTKRVDSANDALTSKRRSMVENQRAELADRGLTGDGAETSALGRLDTDLGNEFGQNLTDIYSDESKQADARMMQALTTKAGLSIADAQNLVDQYNAQTGRQNADTNKLNADNNFSLGQGDLAVRQRIGDQNFSLGSESNSIQKLLGLGDQNLRKYLGDQSNTTANRGLGITETGQQLDWDKFMSQFGLDREKFAYDQSSDPTSAILELIRNSFGGANTAAGGHV
jgi:hypothetical protein